MKNEEKEIFSLYSFVDIFICQARQFSDLCFVAKCKFINMITKLKATSAAKQSQSYAFIPVEVLIFLYLSRF